MIMPRAAGFATALASALALVVVSTADAVSDPVGRGVEALIEGNYAEAYCVWKPLAERGDADAQYNLGWLYANGNGLNVDIATAVDWWRRAAKQGHADAQFAVALAFTTGEGIARDRDEAVRWYIAAARQGHTDAREILGRLVGDLGGEWIERHPELLDEPWFGWPGRINGDRINVRAEASTQAKILTQLEKGEQVRVVGRKGQWLLCLLPEGHDSGHAWIYANLVTPIED